ncbi:uncharacterized protein L969DRAFT_47908 [Mixia osmundae IAM 14324]|uniref:Nucleoporin Nup188 N-terminal subdomain III domain-containing protein n=1 Tax=Mixia osmundae (strain CBS 9802 / IAM 14324 / JCM 22182 / KY 12970) TaxID=764103 RepID=G7E8W3_MIXOS|nr:uncharacterized protein L969DRAFT_47908 [Mixia osmundae IAM 14324]KEI40216.1 hypothetical protein L969DRAFT_47908 [Mixia osmundae IAM 14324]GAA99581.1 hypothetical protein E5Q_06282 [Mixia osmundae IAM 14324]
MSMASPAPREDSPLFVTYATLLSSLEFPSSKPLPSWLVKFSSSNVLAKLKAIDKPFGKPNTASASKVVALTPVTALSTDKLTKDESALALVIAEQLDIDEIEAIILLRKFWIETRQDGPVSQGLKDSPDFWHDFAKFYYLERLSLLGVLAHALRTVEDPEHVHADVYSGWLDEILHTQFCPNLLKTVLRLATTQVPSRLRSTARNASSWAKSVLREQQALLECHFLSLYSRVAADADLLADLLLTIRNAEYGHKQYNLAYFDSEAQTLLAGIEHLYILLAVESLNLEQVTLDASSLKPAGPHQPLPPASQLINPATFANVQQAVFALSTAFPVASAPLVMGWSYLLSKLTEFIQTEPSHEAYTELQSQIYPAATTSANTQPLYQQLISFALEPAHSALEVLRLVLAGPLVQGRQSMLSTQRLLSSNANALGYLSVSRSLLVALLQLIKLPYLGDAQYTALIGLFETIYDHPDARLLRAQFWHLGQPEEDEEGDYPERALLEVARRKFPYDRLGLLRVLRAVSGKAELIASSSADREIDQACSESVLTYLSSLSTLVHEHPTPPALTPRPYEPIESDPSKVRALRPIPVSRSITIPAGAEGVLMSAAGVRPVLISWNLAPTNGWSGLRYLADLVDSCAGAPAASVPALDPFQTVPDAYPRFVWSSPEQSRSELALTLELVTDLLNNAMPDDVQLILSAIQADGSNPTWLNDLFELLRLSFKDDQESGRKLMPRLLDAISILLPHQSGIIWTFIAASTKLFQTSISAYPAGEPLHHINDRMTGHFDTTLSAIALLHSLILECQRSSLTDEAAFADLKAVVLERALHWLLDEIWIVHDSWKYAELTQRFQLTSTLSVTLSLLVDEASFADLARKQPLAKPCRMVLEALLLTQDPVYIAPLLNAFVRLPKLSEVFSVVGRQQEAAEADLALASVTSLANSILRLRRQYLGMRPCPLEVYLLEAQPSGQRSTTSGLAFSALLETALLSSEITLAVPAFHLLTTVSILAVDYEHGTSALVSSLGSADRDSMFHDTLLDMMADSFRDEELRTAAWTFAASLIDAGVGYGHTLVTGQPGAHDRPSNKNVIAVATATLADWDSLWRHEPKLLHAIVRLLALVWQNRTAYGDNFPTTEPALGPVIRSIALASLPIAATDEDDSESFNTISNRCFRVASQAYAVSVAALDTVASAVSGTSSLFVSASLLSALFKNRESVDATIEQLSSSSYESLPPEKSGLFSRDSYRYQDSLGALDPARSYGIDYEYAIERAEKTLHGLSASELDASVDSVLLAIMLFNANRSTIGAELLRLRAWSRYLEIAFAAEQTEQLSGELIRAAVTVLAEASQEHRSGALITTLHAERLQLVLCLGQAAMRIPQPSKEEATKFVSALGTITQHVDFPLAASLHSYEAAGWHRPCFGIIVCAYRIFNRAHADAPLPLHDLPRLRDASLRTLDALLESLRLLFSQATGTMSEELDADLALAVMAVLAIPTNLVSPQELFASLRTSSLVRTMCDLISRTDRSSYATHALDFMLQLARHKSGAELLGLDGVMTALCAASPTDQTFIEAAIVSGANYERPAAHRQWCQSLALASHLIAQLGDSEVFISQDTLAFLSAYNAQLKHALTWQFEREPLTLPLLEEMELIVVLFGVLVQHRSSTTRQMYANLAKNVLGLCQQLVWYLLHPNRLRSIMESTNQEEASWLANSEEGEVDPNKLEESPVAAALLQKVIAVVCDLTRALATYASSISIIRSVPMDWPMEALLVDLNKEGAMTLPAILGSFIDLSGFCFDQLRSGSSGAAAQHAGATTLPRYDPETFVQLVTDVQEATIVLAATQMALYLKEASQRADQETDRACREISSELATELSGQLEKAPSSQQRMSTAVRGFLTSYVLRPLKRAQIDLQLLRPDPRDGAAIAQLVDFASLAVIPYSAAPHLPDDFAELGELVRQVLPPEDMTNFTSSLLPVPSPPGQIRCAHCWNLRCKKVAIMYAVSLSAFLFGKTADVGCRSSVTVMQKHAEAECSEEKHGKGSEQPVPYTPPAQKEKPDKPYKVQKQPEGSKATSSEPDTGKPKHSPRPFKPEPEDSA